VTVAGRAGKAVVAPEVKLTEPEDIFARTDVTPFGSETVPTRGNVAFWNVPRAGATIEGAGLVRERRKVV
jgi:hypothetical protein